tara:strand:+ start:1992 stop:2372 length:381 start_codon:yes stop_codon:yes gene_type:complete
MKNRLPLIIVSILGALAVALGAFGAHALEDSLSPERLETWNTAVTYQMWHVLAILSLILISKVFELELKWSINLMIAGIFIFSGSLYILCLTDINWLGAITPIGGVCFILGWLLVVWNIFQSKSSL